MFADRPRRAPAQRLGRSVSPLKRGQPSRMGKQLARPVQSATLSLSQQLDLADSRDPTNSTPFPATPRTNRCDTHSFNFSFARYSSPLSGDDEEESFHRVFMRQRIYTPTSSRSQRSIKMRASSPEPVTSSPRVVSRLPGRVGASATRQVRVNIELLASGYNPAVRTSADIEQPQTRKAHAFDTAISNSRITWGNIQYNVAAVLSDDDFGLDIFDEVVGKWRQVGLDGHINVLPSQTLVQGRVVHAHALLLDAIELPSTNDEHRPAPTNSNGKRPAFPPLKMGPRTDKKAKTA